MFNALHYDSNSDLSHNGTTTHKPIPNTPTIHELIVDAIILHPQDLHRKLPDLESLCPHLAGLPPIGLVILSQRPANTTV